MHQLLTYLAAGIVSSLNKLSSKWETGDGVSTGLPRELHIIPWVQVFVLPGFNLENYDCSGVHVKCTAK